MKILMISSYLPYPLHSGGQIRLYNLIKELSTKHEITLICEKRPHQTENDVKNLEKICKKVITVARHKQWSLKNITKTILTPHSFLVTGHTHKQLQKLIQEELQREKFDLIHVETFYVMQNVLESGIIHSASSGQVNQESWNVPIVLVEHNIEYQVYQRFVKRVPLLFRPLLSLDVAKIRREEEYSWKQATKVIAVSEEDKKIMEKSGIDAAIVSNGVNLDEFAFKTKDKTRLRPDFAKASAGKQGFGGQRKILFIGDFKWIQNQDSVKFIIEEIFPQIKSVISNEVRNPMRSLANARDDMYRLWIVGRKIPDSIRSLTSDQDVLFDEESSNKKASEIFQEADVLLSPIRVGGGTSYKILESMSCGTPVVTMPMSANAINATDGEDLMVGKTAYELAEKTRELLENKKLYEKIAQNGRKLIEEKYSWKKIAEDLERVYKNVILSS